MKARKISPYVYFITAIFIVIHLIYVQGVIPPLVGWWNYYAWRVDCGDILYKDIFCYLPSYFIYLTTFLYKIFGNFLMGFQIVGLILRFIEVCVIYSILNTFTSKNISFLSVFAGLVLEISYLMNMPYDYNQLIRFYVIMSSFFCMKAMVQKKEYMSNMCLAIAGIWLGIGLFSKQTCIVIIVCAICGIIVFYLHNDGMRRAVKKAVMFALGVFVACLPGILALIIQNSFSDFIYCLTSSMTVKGDFGGFFGRVLQYQVHFPEIMVAIIIFIVMCCQQRYIMYCQKKAVNDSVRTITKEVYFVILFLFIVYRACQIVETETGIAVSYAVVVISVMAYIAIRLAVVCIQRLLRILPEKVFGIFENLTPVFICGFLLFIIVITYRLDYQWKSRIYYQMALFALKRGLVNVIFWVMLFVLLCQTVQYIRKQKMYGGLSCFVLNAFAMCLLGMQMISSVVEELFILPVASLFFALLFNVVLNYGNFDNEKIRKNPLYKLTAGLALTGIIFLSLFITVIQKQVVSYTWHGWDCAGLGRNDTYYVYSGIDGLGGYILDIETEKAYETIIDFIRKNTDTTDVVYEFPHIPLFNVLTERKLGTYSPVHYWDVCPDEIAIMDAQYLNNCPPKMVIWCEFGDGLWNFHEDYFRDGNASGQRAIRDFYWNNVQKNYTKLYEYRTLSVWLREEPD